MMPAEFLLNLCFISRNPEFVMELTEKVLNNTQIVFTVLEESEEVEKKTKHTYDIETSVQYKYETYSEGALVDESLSEPEISVEEDKVDKTKTFTRQVTPIVKITYVKTWFVEQEFIYNRVTKEPVEEEIKEDDPRNLLEDEEKREHTNFELIEDNVVEGTGDKTYESRLERKINQTLYRKNTTTLITYEEGINKEPLDKADDFIELLKKPFRKPNSFSKEPAIINIVSGAEILLQMLQNNERTQAVEHIMRYVLYKYTGESYGVTELNLNMFDLNSFTSLSNTNFSTYLRQFSHSSEAPQSVDGKYYLMYGDAEENEYGWPTIGNADIQWASHHQEFATSGKVLKDGEEQTVPNVETYVNSILGNGAEEKYITSEIREMQIYIEKQVVDQVGDSIQKTSLKYVENNTQGLDLSKQQLYALTTIKYNFGNLPTTNGKSFKNVYEEGAALYEINSWEHNRYIWDNWWALLGGGEPGHIPARDAAFETYVKGIYDFSQSDAGEVFGRNYYIYYTQEQLARFSYAPSKRITRTALNEPAIFKYEENTVGTNGIIDLEGMELSTYTNSKELTFIEFKQDSGTWASMKYGETTIANEGCSITTISIVASSYGINKTPNEWTPSGNYISILNTIKQFAPNTVAVPIQGNGKSDGFAHQNVRNTDKKAIQEHLETGNPVVIHVLGNKKGYTNPYTSNQHWMALLDVSEDGKQVYVSNPNKNGGNGWVDIEYVLQALCCYYKVQQ